MAEAEYNEQVYQFRIMLKRSKPPIWRRIIVPKEDTLNDLHEAIQSVMEWNGSHLWLFGRHENPLHQAAPPDDCGGISGYYDMLKIINNPSDPQYAEMWNCLELMNCEYRFKPDYRFNPSEMRISLCSIC